MAQPSDDELRTLADEILSGLADWRSQHPQASFREIEEEVELRVARLRASMLQAAALASSAADWQDQASTQQPHCPDCQQPLTRRGRQTRRLRSQHNQSVLLSRQYGTCPQCGRGFFPPR